MGWKTTLSTLVGVSALAAVSATKMAETTRSVHEMNIVNGDGSSHAVDVLVTKDNKTVFGGTKALAGERRWNVTTIDTSGAYQLHVRVDGSTDATEGISLPVGDGERRSFTDVRITADGRIAVQTYR